MVNLRIHAGAVNLQLVVRVLVAFVKSCHIDAFAAIGILFFCQGDQVQLCFRYRSECPFLKSKKSKFLKSV